MKPTIITSFVALFFGAIVTNLAAQSIDTAKYYTLSNAMLGEDKVVTGMVDANLGNSVMLRPAVKHPMQLWVIVSTKYGYNLRNVEHGADFSLEVVNEGSDSKWVSLGPTTKNASGQFWRISRNPDNTYRITSLWQGTEKALDFVKEGENANKLVLLPTESGLKSQSWKLVGIPKPKPAESQSKNPEPTVSGQLLIDTAAVFKLTNQFRGKDMAMEAVRGKDGMAKPALRAASNSKAQLWKFKDNKDGFYRVVNHQYPEMHLDIVNDGKLNYNLCLSPAGNYSGQFWKAERNNDGSYRFTSMWQSAKSLDVLNTGNKDELIINASGRYSGQFWVLTKVEGGDLLPSPPPAAVDPSGSATEARPVVTNANNQLKSGQELFPGNEIVSANGTFSLTQQEDGNLVVYRQQHQAVWATGTNGKQVERCVMQTDGNLVLYGPDDSPKWASNTQGNEGAYLVLNDNGTLTIVNSKGAIIWQSHAARK